MAILATLRVGIGAIDFVAEAREHYEGEIIEAESTAKLDSLLCTIAELQPQIPRNASQSLQLYMPSQLFKARNGGPAIYVWVPRKGMIEGLPSPV